MIHKVARSPHIIELLASYAGMGLFEAYLCLWRFQMPVLNFLAWFTIGAAIYTFLEYWFHRFLLHKILHSIHNNHHLVPRNLRIIATPLLPVQFVGFSVTFIMVQYIGRDISYALNTGICFGQCMMDLVHVAFHSPYRPWFLESARSFHLHHHFLEDGNAHGLTTSFWDMIFGTFPQQWYYYKKYPWLKYIQLPFPLLTFVITGLLCGDTTKRPCEKDTRLQNTRYQHGNPRVGRVLFAVFITVCIFFAWEYVAVP